VHEKLQAQAIQAEEVADVTFGQPRPRRQHRAGARRPRRRGAVPDPGRDDRPILAGKDVLARGRTGSGKTIAFGAPLVESILRSQAGKRRAFGRSPKALILAPDARARAADRPHDPADRPQRRPLHDPDLRRCARRRARWGAEEGRRHHHRHAGRIEDLQNQGKLDLSEIGIVVLDEADHMSELGFLEPMQRILRLAGRRAEAPVLGNTRPRGRGARR
jgi:hypothetical protein